MFCVTLSGLHISFALGTIVFCPVWSPSFRLYTVIHWLITQFEYRNRRGVQRHRSEDGHPAQGYRQIQHSPGARHRSEAMRRARHPIPEPAVLEARIAQQASVSNSSTLCDLSASIFFSFIRKIEYVCTYVHFRDLKL
jgi:hypothetical protein